MKLKLSLRELTMKKLEEAVSKLNSAMDHCFPEDFKDLHDMSKQLLEIRAKMHVKVLNARGNKEETI